MNKVRFYSIITIVFAVLLVITGYFISFVDGYVVDAREFRDSISLIKNSYDSYFMDLNSVASDIKNNNINNIKYYEDVKNNYVKNANILESIEEKIKDLEETSNFLLYQCNSYDYNDLDIENKCSTIDLNYKNIVNAYVKLIKNYNEKIDKYNRWTTNKDYLENYSSSYYQDYIN